jgi:nucleoside-diphosphate kinase
MTRGQAETFCAVHKGRPIFFGKLIETAASGPVIAQVLEGENAIAKYREVFGATDPAKAVPGTIPKAFASPVGENSAHGSDGPETAATEFAQWFLATRSSGDGLSPPLLF